MSTDTLLTRTDAAKRLGISKRSLEREIARGRFPRPFKIGRSSRWPASDVLQYLERLSRERSTAS